MRRITSLFWYRAFIFVFVRLADWAAKCNRQVFIFAKHVDDIPEGAAGKRN